LNGKPGVNVNKCFTRKKTIFKEIQITQLIKRNMNGIVHRNFT